jgi:hypothetical protein
VYLSEVLRSALMPRQRLVLCLLLVLLPPLSGADIEFLTQELPWAVVDKSYAPPPLESRTSGACPLGGISYAVVSGALPPGLQLSRLGYLSGVPLRAGSFEIAIRVSNGCTWTARHFVLTTAAAPVLSSSPRALVFVETAERAVAVQTVHISATWPVLAYQVSSDSAWLTATPELGFMRTKSASQPGGDTLRVRVDGHDLKPGSYQGTITISAWQAAEALRIQVVLTLNEAQP